MVNRPSFFPRLIFVRKQFTRRRPAPVSQFEKIATQLDLLICLFAPPTAKPYQRIHLKMSHFTKLLELLRQEKDEDLSHYKKFVREKPLAERVETGFSWYPLKVVGTGFTFGEKAFVTVERTSQINQPHQLRGGQTVSLFSNQNHVQTSEIQGVIHFVERNKMKIILHGRDVPDWVSMGQIGVDMLFDDRSYLEMERAIKKVSEAKGNRLAELRDILTGKKQPLFDTVSQPVELPELNKSQNEALNQILSARDVAIIHGPPGTGKTTTVVAAIKMLCARENCVLVTAPSNTAADLLTERLDTAGLNVVRIGNLSRIDESIVRHTLDFLLTKHPESKHIKKVKLEAAELRRQSRRHIRNYGREERDEKKHLQIQSRELEMWANELEQKLIDQILAGAQVICCTLVGAVHPVLEKMKFRTCVMDEAAQALEPAAWIPILKSSKIIFSGDPLQLPPTVKNHDAAKKGLSETLMERALAFHPEAVSLLKIQYRMNRSIMGFSNQYFYDGALEAHESVANRRLFSLENSGNAITFFEPVIFVDTAGCGFEEKMQRVVDKKSNSKFSRFNPEEAMLVREQLMRLLSCFSPENYPTIAIISPYREQVNYLERMILDDVDLAALLTGTPNKPSDKKLTINTIDGFQGQERDVVLISLVRSNPKNEIGFLSDYRRMNVAMTRARMLLIVTGDSSTIGKDRFYKQFLDYCERIGKYQTGWEYMS